MPHYSFFFRWGLTAYALAVLGWILFIPELWTNFGRSGTIQTLAAFLFIWLLAMMAVWGDKIGPRVEAKVKEKIEVPKDAPEGEP